ncbi:MAG TPA: hypothetical protein VHA33_23390 [Candidatus Angelobacter sp.]|nr:hypothetical protein [Candidatus Angelobacter sp.]
MNTLPASGQSQSRSRSRLGCLTQIILVFVVAGAVMLAFFAVAAPWAFYMGGRFHLVPVWQGWGRLHSNSAGGDYALYVSLWPDHGRFRQLVYVTGTAVVCTPRGERFVLTLGGSFDKPAEHDLNGKKAGLYMFNRNFKRRYAGGSGRPQLELRGHWSNPDLVGDDDGSIARNFGPDARLYADGKSRPYMGEVSSVTLHEGGKSEFEAACRAVQSH